MRPFEPPFAIVRSRMRTPFSSMLKCSIEGRSARVGSDARIFSSPHFSLIASVAKSVRLR